MVPRRLQVSHEHTRTSHVTQYKDNKVAMATNPYKSTEKKEPDKLDSNFVPMETTYSTGCADDVDMHYDGQFVLILCFHDCKSFPIIPI